MTTRDVALRLFLVVGALATVATSAPPDDVKTVQEETDAELPEAVRVRLNLNADALESLNQLTLEFDIEGDVETVTLVPDDPNLPVVSGEAARFIDLTDVCRGLDESCSQGFTLDVSGTGSAIVRARATAYRDGFADDFPNSATVEIVFE